MCTGLEIGALAATALGTAMQMHAQAQAKQETQDALAANRRSNNKLEQNNANEAAKARLQYKRDGAQGFDSKLSNDQAALGQKYKAVQSGGDVRPGEFGYEGRDIPQEVKQYETQKRG